ncbi:MAG: ABC transporter ATP-binding protein [Candidatus Sumerlaeota bacterium]|nr:ABC transporter ATP-binding protein [Candidatus Sumerlaeota bacterium]
MTPPAFPRYSGPMDNAVELRGLSKKYVVEEDRAYTLKESALRLFRTTARQEIEALRPLDLDVRRGETLGIVGANGAGKSTLLKLISGVASPTAGTVRVDGTLMALIELGAGFQPELSGIENVFLNGSLLGLSDRRIRELLPSILEFSGLGVFVHTPVKRYSSGMVLRLGFAIAAHVEPDVILLDENLAVGDAAFQIKCQAKLVELKRSGRTIVLVTHSLDMAEWLCDRIVWLSHGGVASMGAPGETIKRYEQAIADMELRPWSEEARRQHRHSPLTERFGTGDAVIREFSLRDSTTGAARHVFGEGEPMTMEIAYEARRTIPNLNAEVSVHREDGLSAFLVNATEEGRTFHVERGEGVIKIAFDQLWLRPGRYLAYVGLSPNDNPSVFFDLHLRMYHFLVEPRHATQFATAIRLPARLEMRTGG